MSLKEGEKTLGLWLPLALSTITQLLYAVAGVKNEAIPKTSEILGSWVLPMLSEAMSEAEASHEAKRLFDAIKNLEAKKK